MFDRPEMILRQEWVLRTFVPLAAVIGSTAIELALQSTHGERASLLVLLSCIWIVAWMFGWRSGLIATGVGALAALYYVIPPANSFRILNVADGVQFGLFGVQGVLASVFCGMQRRTAAARADAQTRERAARCEADAAKHRHTRCSQELKRARADWKTASAVVSTDLRGHIVAVMSNLQSIETGQMSAEGRNLIAALREETQEALELVEGLGKYSRACDMEQDRSTVNMGELWEAAISNCRTHFDRTFVLKCGQLPSVRASEKSLIQAFEGIAEAAIPFAKAEQPVEISVTVGTMPGEWAFSVSDGGWLEGQEEGQDISEHIRTVTATETVLQLAICRRLIESQGGRIWSAGRLEGGASCVFSMPRVS